MQVANQKNLPKFQPSKKSHQNLEMTPDQSKKTNLLAYKFQGDEDSHNMAAFEDTPDQQRVGGADYVLKNDNAQKIVSSQFALSSNKKKPQLQSQVADENNMQKNLYYNSSSKKNSARLNSNRQKQNQKPDDENNYVYNSNHYKSQQRSNQENLLNENKSHKKKPKHFDTALNELEFNILQEGINPQNQDKKSAIITQLLVSPKRINKVQKKKLASNKMYQDALCQRLYEEQKIFDENMEKRIMTSEEEELKQCSFQPNFNSNKPEHAFDLKAFMEGQVQFQKNVKDRRNHVEILYKNSNIDEYTHSPEICIKSEELVKNRNVSNEYGVVIPTHERLFKLSKTKNQQLIIGQKSPESKDFFVQSVKSKEESNFQPLISEKSRNIQRSMKIDDLLYEDAKRRIQKQKLIDSYSKDTMRNLILDQQPNTKITQNKTARMIAERFVREFEFLASMYIGQDEEQKFDYITLGEVLYRMGFITNKEGQNTNSPIFAKERKLLFNLWTILRGDINQGVLKQNLCVFLLAILGILWKIPLKNQSIQSGFIAHALPKDSDREPFLQSSNFFPSSTKKQLDQLDSQDKQQFSQSNAKTDQKSQTQQSEILEKAKNFRKDEKLVFGRFNSNQFWEINYEEMRQLHGVYDLFYRNMLHSQEVKRAKYNWEPEYKPFILETSKMLAAGHREKILQETANMIENQTLNVRIPENGKITHADLLTFQRQAQIQQKKQVKENIESEVFKSCTFKPDIAVSQSKQSFQQSQQQQNQFASPKSQLGVNRSLQLYTLAKPLGTKRDKTTLEVEYERNCDECTFTPDLNFSKGDKTYINKNQVYAKNIDKTIERMRAARAEKEVVDWWKEGRGYDLPTYESYRTKQSQFQQNEEEENSQQLQSQQQMPQETENEEQLLQNEENQIEQYQDQQDEEQQVQGGRDEQQNQQNNLQDNQNQNQQIPLLYVDVNLGQGRSERIVIYEGQKSEDLAQQFAQEHNLDEYMSQKLKIMIDAQIAGILHRIEEEMPSITSDVQESMRKEYQ